MVNYVVELFRFTATYILCFYYSLQALLGIFIEFFTSSHAHFLHMKKRPYPPQCLVNHNFGEHNFITVNGIKLHYVDKGDNTKPLMVLVHGFPEFWFSWRFQLNEFSKDYWVVAVDLRGYGDSEKPASQSAYRIDNMTNDIRELVRALGREKFTLVGHDWGAVIGWNYITKYMDTIDKYIMMGAPARSVQRKLMTSSMAQFKMSWYIFFFQLPWLPEFQLKLCDLKIFENMFKTHVEDVVEAYKYTFSKKREDLVVYSGEIYNPFTPVVSPTVETSQARIDKMYIQTASGYRPVDNTTAYYKSPILGDRQGNNHTIKTGVHLSCAIQRCWLHISNICHGLLAGLALAHLLLIFTTKPYDWVETSIRHYSSFAEIYANTFYCLAMICMVSIFDRLDISHINLTNASENVSFRSIVIVMIYAATIILSLSAGSMDERLYLTSLNVTVWEEELETNKVLSIWNSLSIARSFGAICGWFMIGLQPNEDLLYSHLVDMERYQIQ